MLVLDPGPIPKRGKLQVKVLCLLTQRIAVAQSRVKRALVESRPELLQAGLPTPSRLPSSASSSSSSSSVLLWVTGCTRTDDDHRPLSGLDGWRFTGVTAVSVCVSFVLAFPRLDSPHTWPTSRYPDSLHVLVAPSCYLYRGRLQKMAGRQRCDEYFKRAVSPAGVQTGKLTYSQRLMTICESRKKGRRG